MFVSIPLVSVHQESFWKFDSLICSTRMRVLLYSCLLRRLKNILNSFLKIYIIFAFLPTTGYVPGEVYIHIYSHSDHILPSVIHPRGPDRPTSIMVVR